MNTFIGPDKYITKSVIYLRCWHIVPDVGFKPWLSVCGWKLHWHFKKHLLKTLICEKKRTTEHNVSNTEWKFKVITWANSESMKAQVQSTDRVSATGSLWGVIFPKIFTLKYVKCVNGFLHSIKMLIFYKFGIFFHILIIKGSSDKYNHWTRQEELINYYIIHKSCTLQMGNIFNMKKCISLKVHMEFYDNM